MAAFPRTALLVKQPSSLTSRTTCPPSLSGGLLICAGSYVLERGNAGVLKTPLRTVDSGLLFVEYGGEDDICGCAAIRAE